MIETEVYNKELRYIWVAKWRFPVGFAAHRLVWSSFVSKKSNLDNPICVTYSSTEEADACKNLIDIVYDHRYIYDFVVVEHPNKLIMPFKEQPEQKGTF